MTKVSGLVSEKVKVSDGGDLNIPCSMVRQLGLNSGDDVLIKETTDGFLVRGIRETDYKNLNTATVLSRLYRRVQVRSSDKGYGKTHLISNILLSNSNDKSVLVVGSSRYRDSIVAILKGLDKDNNVAVSVLGYRDFLFYGHTDIVNEGFSTIVIESRYMKYDSHAELINKVIDTTNATYIIELSEGMDETFKYNEPALDLNLKCKVRGDTQYNDCLYAHEYTYKDGGVLVDKVKLN